MRQPFSPLAHPLPNTGMRSCFALAQARCAARRAGLVLLLAGIAALPAVAQAGTAFGFDSLTELARTRAQTAYRAPPAALPAALAELDYDAVRDIRWRPARALWREARLPFEAMFFHLGLYHRTPVRIHEISRDGVRPLRFDPADFDYGRNQLPAAGWGDLGFAGLRIHYPLNNPQYKDELVVFQGASYFRALGAGQQYGLSARGLAIDPHGGRGEEFPRFTEFWLVRPAADARTLTVYALLDSPRASGAYRFDVHPGSETVMDVRARLFLRAPVATLGIAPLTSMFFFGENQPHRSDFRPEVHDSDGLSVATGEGEWIWRPLVNPNAVFTTSFAMRGLRGFGLMQRDRSFASYEDGEARYELRPSAWVEPVGDWGAGRVELVQLHTADETNDNVVAYWVPKTAPAPGHPLDLTYRVRWQGAEMQRPPGAWVVQTRTGRGFAELAEDERQFVVDFTGPSLASLPANAPVEAVVTAPVNGTIVESNAYKVEATGAWRMFVRAKQIRATEPTELRGFLKNGKDVLTETWSNVVPPR